MINNKILLFFPFLLVLNTACKLGSKKKSDVINTNLSASCDIQTITFDYLECIEFNTDYSGDSENICNQAKNKHGLLVSMNYRQDSNATFCWPFSKVASCSFHSHRVYFYEDGYTAGAAQTECNTLGGTFEQIN